MDLSHVWQKRQFVTKTRKEKKKKKGESPLRVKKKTKGGGRRKGRDGSKEARGMEEVSFYAEWGGAREKRRKMGLAFLTTREKAEASPETRAGEDPKKVGDVNT